jgi:hypothetical protein
MEGCHPPPPPPSQYGGFYRKLVREQIVPRHLCKYKFQSPVRSMTFSSFPYSGHSRLSTRLPLMAGIREITEDVPEQRVLNDLKEDQAFSPSNDLAPPPPLPHSPSPVSKSLFHKLSSCVCCQYRARERGRSQILQYDGEKTWSSKNHSILPCLEVESWERPKCSNYSM